MAAKRKFKIFKNEYIEVYEKSIGFSSLHHKVAFLTVNTDFIPDDAFQNMAKAIRGAYIRGKNTAREETAAALNKILKPTREDE